MPLCSSQSDGSPESKPYRRQRKTAPLSFPENSSNLQIIKGYLESHDNTCLMCYYATFIDKFDVFTIRCFAFDNFLNI